MPTSNLSSQDALIYAMITVAAVDRTISEPELARISSIVRELPPFATYNNDWLLDSAQACGRILSGPNGVAAVFQKVKAVLPPELYETAYVLAAEVAASDLEVHAEELKCLDLLAEALGLDALVCAALTRAARARHHQI